jgi:hypothetical protein
MGKKLAENPIIILIGLVASIIAIYSFITGSQSIDISQTIDKPNHSVSDGLSIRNIVFCEYQFFDTTQNMCMTSQVVFPQGISMIYASWTYGGNYSGEFTRRWYRSGVYLDNLTRPDQEWGLDGQTDYTYVINQNGFVAGEYLLEFRLNADNGLIISTGFRVQ